MSAVVCFGEALIDFLNTGTETQEGLPLNRFTQFPGGAPANAAVAIAKLGGRARFAGQVGADTFGDFLIESLRRYGVDTTCTVQHPTAPTALAFVFLDENGDRSFLFHRRDSADLLLTRERVTDDWFADAAIFHFCSNTLTEPAAADVTEHAVAQARQGGLLISFDVNLRHNLWPQGQADRDRVMRLMPYCDLVKLSRDELDYLAGDARGETSVETFTELLVASGIKWLLITDGANPVEAMSAKLRWRQDVPRVEVADTTAAGDAFTGGLLFGLNHWLTAGGSIDSLLGHRDGAENLVSFAIQCGALTVTRLGAFPALPSMAEVSKFWQPYAASL